MAKKVVYLLGSGATQGVVAKAENQSLLTRDIQAYIGDMLRDQPELTVSDKIWNEIIKEGRDVEHLITVLDCQYKYQTANKARDYYHRAIVDLAGRITEPLGPTLYTYLVDLHLRSKLRDAEELLCFLSLNYEDILERSIEAHLPHVKIDYAIETEGRPAFTNDDTVIPVLKLHGSFNWENRRPITIKEMKEMPSSEYTLWIPPGVDKKKEHYPFNLLWGKAVQFISEADILRVVGCSLSRNDWGIIPILYTAQSLTDKANLQIELVDYTEPVDRTVDSYKYLDFIRFVDLPEISSFKPYGVSPLPRETAKSYFSEVNAPKINIFDHWLRAKIEFLYTVDGVMRDDLLNKADAKLVAHYFTNAT